MKFKWFLIIFFNLIRVWIKMKQNDFLIVSIAIILSITGAHSNCLREWFNLMFLFLANAWIFYHKICSYISDWFYYLKCTFFSLTCTQAAPGISPCKPDDVKCVANIFNTFISHPESNTIQNMFSFNKGFILIRFVLLKSFQDTLNST